MRIKEEWEIRGGGNEEKEEKTGNKIGKRERCMERAGKGK